jgi:uncharacterized protein GlcG (DUF336 family)
METQNTTDIITELIDAIEQMIPRYMNDPEDKAKSKGSVAFCIIDESGNVHGKFIGTDKIRAREMYRVAWTKASQVYITGVKTGEFERMYFNDLGNVNSYGIKAPELIGWEGGQPLKLKNGKTIFAGFSGFRGSSDIEIVQRALAEVENRY